MRAYRSAKELRDELDSAGLIEEAGRRKDAANGFLQKGLLEPAMQGYLAAIWLLKVSRPTYPEVLSGQMPPTDEEAAGLLGSGRGAAPAPPRIVPGRVAAVQRSASRAVASVRARLFPPPPPDALESEGADALRLALHLNVAACALRRDDYYLAREACLFVLAAQPVSPKALYRLAQAHEGRDETSAAVRALTALLKVDSQNREARQMRERLKEALARERDFYGGIGAKVGFGETDAPPPPPSSGGPEPEDALTQRIRALLDAEEKAKAEGKPLPGEA